MNETDSDRVACRALALAVLKDAINELETARRLKDKAQERESLAWINSNSVSWVFSFVPLCEWLGFDAEAIRKKLQSKVKV